MRRWTWLWLIFGVMTLVNAPLQAQDAPPTYAVPGPHVVGRSWFVLNTGTPDAQIMLTWYPASSSESGTFTVPDASTLVDKKRVKLLEGVAGGGKSTYQAIPEPANTPYPLVIYSPGYTGSPVGYASLEEHLASYGFVVMSPQHKDDALWSHYILRPADITHLIDFAETLNKEGSFKDLIDTSHVGIVGHSSGGYTALASAGGRLDMSWFEGWCTDHADSPDAIFVCPDLLSHKQDMVSLAKLDAMPTGLWPDWSDPRVSAVVTQSGDAYVFGPDGLASIKVPVMVQVGIHDNLNTPEWSAYLTYDHISSAQKSEAVFNMPFADHAFFSDGVGTKPMHDIINHFTTAFLLDQIKGDKDAHAALLPDAVKFEDIDYKTTLK